MSKSHKQTALHILVCVSGSIAAYKAAVLVSALSKKGYTVRCVMSETAHEFIGASALAGITRFPVYTSLFDAPQEITHISFAQWADLILLYPASAATIARLQAGSAEDIISAIFLANNFQVPYWIAPAMNTAMLAHPAVQRNITVLKQWGCRILPTEEGILACGSSGGGKLLRPEVVMTMVEEELCRRP